MYEKFGEMSVKEMNELADNMFNEGDLQSVKALAKENGIPDYVLKMYLEGDAMELADDITAAIGKLDVEEKELKLKDNSLMKDWVEYARGIALEDEFIAKGIKKKNKSLKGLIGEILKNSFKNQWTVPDEIKKAAGVSTGKVTFGIPNMATVKKTIREYYGGAK